MRRLYALKGRGRAASRRRVIAASVEALLELVPELRGRSETIARALLPGPFTLVLPNPARRYPWLNGARPETIGVRVPVLPERAQRVLDEVGAVAATSANEPGEPAAASLDEVPRARPRGLRRRGRRRASARHRVDGDRLHRGGAGRAARGSRSAAEAIARVPAALDR